MKGRWRRPAAVAALTLVGAALAGVVGAAVFVWSGVYDVSVTSQHTQVVYRLLEQTTRQSVRRHARDGPAPPSDLAARVPRGAVCYQAKCLQCHGAAGSAPADIGLAMQPLPGPLTDASARWDARELHWIVRHGLKMSGMPAWRYRLADSTSGRSSRSCRRCPGSIRRHKRACWPVPPAQPGATGRSPAPRRRPATPTAAGSRCTSTVVRPAM